LSTDKAQDVAGELAGDAAGRGFAAAGTPSAATPLDVVVRQVKEMRRALEETKASLDDNYQEIAQLRVDLRKAEGDAEAQAGLAREAVARAETAEQALEGLLSELQTARNEAVELRRQLEGARAEGVEQARGALVSELQAARNETLELRQQLEIARAESNQVASGAQQALQAAQLAHEQTLAEVRQALRATQEALDRARAEARAPVPPAADPATDPQRSQDAWAREASAAREEILRLDVKRTREAMVQAHAEVQRLSSALADERAARAKSESMVTESRTLKDRLRAVEEHQKGVLERALAEAERCRLDLGAGLAEREGLASELTRVRGEVERLARERDEAHARVAVLEGRAGAGEQGAGVLATGVGGQGEATERADATPRVGTPVGNQELREALRRVGEYKEELARLREQLARKG
jgi:DNA repair exonuclease SbcCD ATPase subunit